MEGDAGDGGRVHEPHRPREHRPVYRGAAGQAAGSFAWTKISGNLTGSSTTSISVIHAVPGGSGVLAYVGTANGRIHRANNALAPSVSWTDVTGNFPAGYVSDVAVDPANSQRVFVTRGAFGASRLYRSTSGGTSWTAVGAGLPNVPANAVAIDSDDARRIFVGTDVGIYESVNGGDTFTAFSLGVPLGLVVTDLEMNAAQRVLVAGTYGRGAYRVNLSGAANVAASADFGVAKAGLGVRFHDRSADPDGNIVSRLWFFGDATSSTEAEPVKTYDTPGTYVVALTVTDDRGASRTVTRSATVSAPVD
jgi:PKD repeat protein